MRQPRAEPVVEGLFEYSDEGIVLRGAHCMQCDALYFPAPVACRNPDCNRSDLGLCRLPSIGTLYSYSWQNYRPPEIFAVDEWQPYAIGMVDIAPGLRVMARLSVPREKLTIGMSLELTADVMNASSERAVEGYVFARAETR